MLECPVFGRRCPNGIVWPTLVVRKCLAKLWEHFKMSLGHLGETYLLRDRRPSKCQLEMLKCLKDIKMSFGH